MEGYLERLIDEEKNLSEKIDTLIIFVCSKKYNSLSKENRALLDFQLLAMRTYQNILLRRIEINK